MSESGHGNMNRYYTDALRKRIGNTWASYMRSQDGDNWDELSPVQPQHKHKYVEHLETYLPDKNIRILELGAGDGSETRLLMDAGWKDVTGVTVGQMNLSRGKELHKVDLYYMDMHFMDFPTRTFDAVIGFQTYEHSPAPILLGLEMNRVLKNGGKILLEVPIGEKHMPVQSSPHHVNVIEDWQAKAQLAMSGFENITTVKRDDMMVIYGEKVGAGDHNNHFNDIVEGKFLN